MKIGAPYHQWGAGRSANNTINDTWPLSVVSSLTQSPELKQLGVYLQAGAWKNLPCGKKKKTNKKNPKNNDR